MPAQICGFAADSSRVVWSACGLRAGTDEIQITHIAKDLLRR